MRVETADIWATPSGSGPKSLLQHRFLTPPYGYVIGVALWPVFVSIISVWVVLWQSGLPSVLPAVVATVLGLVVVVGGFVVTSMSSALVLGITAWNTPSGQIRRQVVLVASSLLVSVLLFGLYLTWPTIPFRFELGLSAFVAHELSKILFLGPATGLAFMLVPLAVLGYRSWCD
jgi:hypothetical protein